MKTLKKLEQIEALLRERNYKGAEEKLANLIGELEASALLKTNGTSQADKDWLLDHAPEIASFDPAVKVSNQAASSIKTMFGLDDGR